METFPAGHTTGNQPEITAPTFLGCLHLELRADHLTVFPDHPARALHGALHRAIERLDPILSAEVHDADVSPLVCSSLVHNGGALDGEPITREVRAGSRIRTTIAVLDGRTLTTLMASLEAMRWRELAIVLERPWTVTNVALAAPVGSALPAIVRYAELAATALPAPEIVLRFSSPTFFRQSGRILSDPHPTAVFFSHFRRWRTFAGITLAGIDAAAIRRGLQLRERPDGEITAAGLLGRDERGFVGTAVYTITGDDQFKQGIATLADYAAYCGTGARTAFGMGMTQRLR